MERSRARFLTVIIVPDAAGRTRNFRLPIRLLQGVGAGLLAAALATGLRAAAILQAHRQAVAALDERDRLRQEAALKQAQIDAMAARVRAIEANLDRLRSLEDRVTRMVESVPGGPGAAGAPVRTAAAQVPRERLSLPSRGGPRLTPGGADGALLLEELALLEAEASARVTSLTRAAEVLEDHVEYLRHRPRGFPVRGPLTSPFGWRSSPIGWGREFHAGVDIGAPWGAPVAATADGTVVYAGWKAGLGQTVIIDHGFGLHTLYGHNSRLVVRPGQEVKRGQTVAHVGSTGRSTGPHVHYEVWRWGRPVDPLEYAD